MDTMAMLLAFPGTRETPAEYNSDAPVTCSHCGAIWDEDDNRDDFTLVDEIPYCNEGCLQIGRLEAIQREVKARILTKLEDLIAEAYTLSGEYEHADEGFHNGAIGVLEDAAQHLTVFCEGRDSGFRSGALMVPVNEADRLIASGRHAIIVLQNKVIDAANSISCVTHLLVSTLLKAGRAQMALENAYELSHGRKAKWRY
jgi:hypothetical protein